MSRKKLIRNAVLTASILAASASFGFAQKTDNRPPRPFGQSQKSR